MIIQDRSMPSLPNPPSISRKRKVREQTREEILQAAGRIFRAKGFHSATAEEIAREAGVAVGTIYNIIGSKEQLYFQVILGIARDLLKRLDEDVLTQESAEEAIERLIHLRIAEYERYQLFFHLFYNRFPAQSRDFNQLPQEVFDSYYNYLTRLGEFFQRAIFPEGSPEYYPFYLALSLEGFIHAFMGLEAYTEQTRPLARISRFIKRMWIESMQLKEGMDKKSPVISKDAGSRQIHITRYDLARLTDLILVYRSFSQGYSDQHLKNLAKELNRAKVVPSRAIPPDVITMNSRVCLLDLDTGERLIVSVVFPADATRPDQISVLDPLGTAMLGYRVGDNFTVNREWEEKRYRVDEMLYQPEAAGDFHL